MCTTVSSKGPSGTDGAAPGQYVWWEEGRHGGGVVTRANLESSGRRVREQREMRKMKGREREEDG